MRNAGLCKHMPKKKAHGAIMTSHLVIAHAVLSDPEAEYRDLGTGYYEQRAGTAARPAATSAAWNASATRSPSSPPPPRPTPKPASSSPAPPANRTNRHKPPPTAAACPAEVEFSDQLHCN
jgi:hypothetical protein